MDRSKKNDEELYKELTYYTLDHAKKDASFIHQTFVDVYALQNATEKSKPVKIAFALMGLYLYLEKEYTGRQVQLAHVELARKRAGWPRFPLPKRTSAITIRNVMDAIPGSARDNALKIWCVSVWQTWDESHDAIKRLLIEELGIA